MTSTPPPNIILLMTDQQRADTIAALGHDHMITPGMDRLVRNGVSFHNNFACGATCIASRAAMFTGMYAHNTGVFTFNRWAHHRTFTHDLRDAGYHCVSIGKMHVSPRDDPMGFHERVIVENPTNWSLRNTGVDDDWGRHLALHGVERPNDRNHTDPNWLSRYQGVPWHLEEHLHSDVFIGNSALAWIERYPQQRDKPLFLQVGFTGPHEPYDPLPRILDLYAGRAVPKPVIREGELDEKPPQHRAHQRYFRYSNHEAQIAVGEATEAEIAEMRRHYYAKITTLDEKLGQVLDALEARGYLDNAVVIFTSDHGDMIGDHQMAYKWLMYDPIVNVPLILWDTRTGVQGETRDLVSHIDVGPTVLDAAGIAAPAYMEGASLMDYVREGGGAAARAATTAQKSALPGVPTAPEAAVYCEDNYEIMARTERYKLVHYTYQEDDGELYDLADDPHELVNRFHDPAYHEVRASMATMLGHWLARSTYRTAGYKNNQPATPRLWPQESPYLMPGYRRVPELRGA